MERLDKLLAATGKWSRKEAKALIKAGRVRVEDRLPKGPEDKVEEGSLVTVDGRPIFTEKYVYLMLHKPAGVISATQDAKEKTVLDLLPQELQRQNLFPVRRLDKDTEGLLLLTNQGGLAHDLLSPKKHVDKEYYVRVDGRLTGADCEDVKAEMRLGDGLVCQPAELVILPEGAGSEAHITIREGKFHQIKRMMAYLGKPVTYLERVRMGNLTLDSALSRGNWRFLTAEEANDLEKAGAEAEKTRNLTKK